MKNYSRTGAILTLVAGITSIFYLMIGIAYFLLPQVMESVLSSRNGDDSFAVMMIFVISGVVLCLFSVVAGTLSIAGGILGLQRKHWACALAGAISAAILFFPVGIMAIVYISLGQPEFSVTQPADPVPGEVVKLPSFRLTDI